MIEAQVPRGCRREIKYNKEPQYSHPAFFDDGGKYAGCRNSNH